MDLPLKNKLRKILNKHDPIGIYFGMRENFDEYDPEIEDIYRLSKQCKNLDTFVDGVHKIFIRWFGPETAKGKEEYIGLSKELFSFFNRELFSKNKKSPRPDSNQEPVGIG
ncbi:hypothetical protein HYS50_02105 [Candidatus Woesearchaeota archaeon]|nr:hypothetical protein [Candidatus Woesearchaeota archaeon]